MSRSSRRLERQNLKQRYTVARENAQLAGLLPTTPEGAMKPERVPCDQPLPDVVKRALRENWATPDAAKPAILAALLLPFFEEDVVMDAAGNAVKVAPDREQLIRLAKLLRDLDQTQFERDNPEAAGQAKGGVALSVQTNIEAARIVRELIERDGGEESLQPPSQPGAPSDGALGREVEAGPAPESDQLEVGPGVEDGQF